MFARRHFISRNQNCEIFASVCWVGVGGASSRTHKSPAAALFVPFLNTVQHCVVYICMKEKWVFMCTYISHCHTVFIVTF